MVRVNDNACSLFILYKYLISDYSGDWQNIYSNNDSKVGTVFKFIEMLPLIELVHHFLDF